jgi:asparaginyl-tRNA synthetase
MQHIDIVKVLNDKSWVGQSLAVCGWVRTSRDSKNVAFLEINDGSCLGHLQVVLDKSKIPNTQQYTPLCTALRVIGKCVLGNDGKSVEIQATELTLIGTSPLEYPIQKKPHTLEYLRTMPHLRMRTNTFNAMFRLRSKLSQAIHQYFWDNGYYYVHAPIITGSDCEGAGEVFGVTTHRYNHAIKDEAEYYSKDFFGTSATLSVSAQLEGEAYAMALGKIYTFGPTFRAENSNTARHAAEFWQIEPEVAWADINDIMEIAQEMIKYIVKYCIDNCRPELELFDKFYEKGLIAKLQSVVDSDFVKLDYTEAIDILQGSNHKFEYTVAWGNDLQTEHERYLCDIVYKCPVFVYNYPKDIKAFYMKLNPDLKTVAATDLLVPGVGEIIGCSERETDYDKLLTTIHNRNMKLSDYTNYLDLRKFGSVPHSGFGLGLERVLMYMTGIGNIRDTQGYPRAKGELRV